MRAPFTRREAGPYANVQMHHALVPTTQMPESLLIDALVMSRPSMRSCSSASPRGAERPEERAVRCIDLDAVGTPDPRQIPADRRAELQLDDARGLALIR